MNILTTIFSIIILVISVMFHELAHGTVADQLGDPTPSLAGRLTLNPFAHLEWLGSLIVPLLCIISGTGFIIGWAKPVPFNANNLKYKRWGPALVAVAGPLMNMLIAVICAIIFRVTASSNSLGTIAELMSMVVVINISLAVFNLIPVPPLDGHHLLGALIPGFKTWSQKMMQAGYGLILLVVVLFLASSVIAPIISFLSTKLLGA